MKWLEETHGPQFELVRHFLVRLFDSEMFTTPGQWHKVAVGAFAMALPAGMLLLDPGYLEKYRRLAGLASPESLRAAAIADELSLLTLVFCVTGLLGLLQWQSLFPSARDYLAMAGMPVRPRQIFVARFLSVLLLSAGIVVAMNALPSILVPLQFGGPWQKNPGFRANVFAQAAASSLACFFVLFALVALQGVLLNMLPRRWFARVSAYAQGLLIGVLFLAALLSWFIADWKQDTLARLPEFGTWAPPVWFAGLHERLLGDGDPFFAAMAGRGLVAVAAAAALMVLAYWVSYRRYRRLLLESPVEVPAPRRWGWSALDLLARKPGQRAVMQFLAKTLARSRLQRTVLLAYIGAALGIMVNGSLLAGTALKWSGGWRGVVGFAVLFWPLGISIIVLAGIRHAYSLPAELEANWLFRICENQSRAEWMSAVERFTLACGIAPIYLVTVPVAVSVVGGPMALRAAAMQILISLTAFEILFHSWQQLPFTCSYVPGKRPLIGVLVGWFTVLGFVVPVLSMMVAAMSRMTETFLVYGSMFCAVWLLARRFRRDGWGEARMIYEDVPEAVPDLGIKEMTYGAGFIQLEPARPPAAPAEEREARRWSPPVLSATWLRLRALVKRRQLDRDLEDELEFHLAMRERHYEAEGIARGEVESAARRRFGNVAAVKEACREMWTFAWLEALWQDVRYGWRQLRRSPGFAPVAILSLALGIGANSAMFSVADFLVLRPLPVPNPAQVVDLRSQLRGHRSEGFSYAEYRDFRDRSRSFQGLAASELIQIGVAADKNALPQPTFGMLVSGNYFQTLEVRPALGRAFHEDEQRVAVAVISDALWKNEFGERPQAVGETVFVNGLAFTVVGVAPAEFVGTDGPFRPALYIPVTMAPQLTGAGGGLLEQRDDRGLTLRGRLKPGVSIAQADAEAKVIAKQLAAAYPDTNRDRTAAVRTEFQVGLEQFPGNALVSALTLALTGIVLLIACANVMNLLLGRARARTREIAVRLAIGAGRGRLFRQLLTESLMLALLGGALGLLVAQACVRAFSRFTVQAELPLVFDFRLNGRVVAYAMFISIASAVVFGLTPALQAARTDLVTALKSGTGGQRRRRLVGRNALVIAQVAGSLLLLICASQVLHGTSALLSAPPGFRTDHILMARFNPTLARKTQLQANVFYRRLLEQARLLPGVKRAALARSVPLGLEQSAERIVPESAEAASVPANAVSEDYFAVLNIPILQGRSFRVSDRAGSPRVAIVNEQFVRKYCKGDPIGQQFRLGSASGPQVQIIGVAQQSKYIILNERPREYVYLPLAQNPQMAESLLLETAGEAAAPAAGLRASVHSIDVAQPVQYLVTMAQHYARSTNTLKFGVWLFGTMGLLGLVLGMVGLYGLMMYSVSRRTREIGIRMALGAGHAKVMRMVLRQGLALAGAGVGIGLLLSPALSRALTAAVYVPPLGLRALLPIPAALLAVAWLGTYIPARRASGVNPVEVLRQD